MVQDHHTVQTASFSDCLILLSLPSSFLLPSLPSVFYASLLQQVSKYCKLFERLTLCAYKVSRSLWNKQGRTIMVTMDHQIRIKQFL